MHGITTRIRDLAPWLGVVVCVLNACVEFSPFETDLNDDERHQTERNLQLLANREPVAGSFHFAAISDSHQDYEELHALVDVLNARDDLAFVIHLGDMTQAGLRQEYRWFLEGMQRLEIPYFTAVGNHDLLSNGAYVYREMFGAYDYTFDFGGVRFVAFNGNYVEIDKPTNDIDWLTEATAPSPEITGVIPFAHQRPPTPHYEAMLNDNGVSAEITGHYHVFADELFGDVPAYQAGTAGLQQWLLVSVEDNEVRVQFCTAGTCKDSLQ